MGEGSCSHALSPVPAAFDRTVMGLSSPGSMSSPFPVSFLTAEKPCEGVDSMAYVCENLIAFIFVFTDRIKNLQFRYLKSSQQFPLATGKLEAESCRICKVLGVHPGKFSMMHLVSCTQ